MLNSELLKVARHYVNDKYPVYVFEHGTVVVGKKLSEAGAKELLQEYYDIPLDGEGSSLGDIESVGMDDGNTLFFFFLPQAMAFAVRSPSEMEEDAPKRASATEVFVSELNMSLEVLAQGIKARFARGLDARDPIIVASWNPEYA